MVVIIGSSVVGGPILLAMIAFSGYYCYNNCGKKRRDQSSKPMQYDTEMGTTGGDDAVESSSKRKVGNIDTSANVEVAYVSDDDSRV